MIEDVLRDLESDATLESATSFVQLATDYLAATARAEGPVSSALRQEELARRFDEPIPENGAPLGAIVERLRRDVFADANRLAHPMYMGHQVSTPLATAVWTDALIAVLNQSIAVAEMSPTGTAIETRVIRWMCGLAGLPPGSGGTLTSGGTEATFTALLAARAAAFPDAWQDGLGAHRPVVLCGEHTHYAVSRAVAQLGLGMRSAITVPSMDYRMDARALERLVERLAMRGVPVMAVVATAGHTATGSFDDLETIGRMCDDRGLWLHVDGAHGASALLSEKHRHHLRGIERARSIAWDPHKMLLLPLAAGMLLVRDEQELQTAFAQRAPYLFHAEGGVVAGEAPRVWDQGIRSFQCSRRADVLKLWVAVLRFGRRGLGALYDHLCDLTTAFHARLQQHPSFEPLHEPEGNILCFRWIGNGSLDEDALDAANRSIRERYNGSGAGWITATVLDGRRVLRVTIMNPRTSVEHIDRLIDGLAVVADGLVGTKT